MTDPGSSLASESVQFRFVGAAADLEGEVARDVLGRSDIDIQRVLLEVAPVRDEIRARGDAALRAFTQRFDGVVVSDLVLGRDAMVAALSRIPADLKSALATAHANVRRFHDAQCRDRLEVAVMPGLVAGRRYVPLNRVGCYVPGGRARYPSTVLMTVVAAKAAGVPDITVATPPARETGVIDDATLAACAVAGANRIVVAGGAQAIFALAYGTESVPRVDKIVGPGNIFVTAAKLLASADVATDPPAGPSEVLVVAEEGGARSPDVLVDAIARELLAQAEHDPDAAVCLVTPSTVIAEATRDRVAVLVQDEPRRDIITRAIARRGAIITTENLGRALEFADNYAPEHLVLMTKDPEHDLEHLSNYGSAFLGPDTPVAFGDYAAGPNHVLPTGGHARASSGLSVDDFVRRPTHTRASPEAAARLAATVATLARAEGLEAHARAAEHKEGRD